MLKNVRILCSGWIPRSGLPWRVTGASVARHVERPWVRSTNAYIAESAPELQPMCGEAPRAEGSAWSWTSTLEICPDLENDEIAGWRRRGHREADARRGARILPRSLGATAPPRHGAFIPRGMNAADTSAWRGIRIGTSA